MRREESGSSPSKANVWEVKAGVLLVGIQSKNPSQEEEEEDEEEGKKGKQ